MYTQTDLKELPNNNPIILQNSTCVYCHQKLNSHISTKEHVIARRFVPKGFLDQSWNLIVKACRECNSKKADLENDISAITLQAENAGNTEMEKILLKEAYRKGKNSISNITKKPVKDSFVKGKIEGPINKDFNLKIELIAPPQIQPSRVFELSKMHILAFFYFITFNKESRTGQFPVGKFYPILEAPQSDWGNDIHLAFMKEVINWEIRWIGNGAKGFFKSAIRKHPDHLCWSWAIEWNQYLRIVGLMGDPAISRTLINSLPKLTASAAKLNDNGSDMIMVRPEKKLKSEDDCLFSWQSEG